MIGEPAALTADGFQQAWVGAVRLLIGARWELYNLVVQIKNPSLLDEPLHGRVTDFARREGLLLPKHVAYTIFPHGLYRYTGNAQDLFGAYNRQNGMYERLHRRRPDWGTYFRRMTHYDKAGNAVNQLGNIIDAIRTRRNLSRAAYTVVIQNPGGETIRPLGGPCLNYIAVQIDAGNPPAVGLLALYRNHDFLERTYGNYWGLCNLLKFLAAEVGAEPGPLTCVSSHAHVSGARTTLKAFVDTV
jgi:hypothetical protein